MDPLASCRDCGCTNDQACLGGCAWVEDDLCSACAAEVVSEGDSPEPLAAILRSMEALPAGVEVRSRQVARVDLAMPQPLVRIRIEIDVVVPLEQIGGGR